MFQNRHRLVLFAGITSLGLCVALAFLSPRFAYELSNDSMPTGIYLVIHFLLWGIMMALGWLMLRKPTKEKKRFSLKLIIGFAILFRLILIPSTPIHESDFYRYQWDGKLAKAGINPFLFEPAALELWEKEIVLPYVDPDSDLLVRGREFSEADDDILERLVTLRNENPVLFERVSHKPVTTIYPPVAQAVFWTSSLLFGDSLIGLKVILVAFDIGVIFLVVGILKLLNRNLLGVIFYAWNPLVLKEFANSAHYDSVPIFFTVLAVYLTLKSRSRLSTATALAAGTLAKYFSVLLMPVLLVESPLFKKWRNLKTCLIPVTLFFVLIWAGFIPFLKWNDAGFDNVFSGLQTYNGRWQNYGFVFPVLRNLIGFDTAKMACAVLLMGVVAIQTLIPTKDNTHLAKKCFIIVAALFILSPTAFPWYFAWVLPFVCLFPRPQWLIIGALLPINYLDFHTRKSIPLAHVEIWEIPLLSWICWGTFLVVTLATVLFRKRTSEVSD